MSNNATVHIKLNPEKDKYLSELARKRQTSKGQLIREAITACYQALPEDLPLHQRQAIAAYQGGFISIGRLAHVMGMQVLDLRKWLQEHGIDQNTGFSEQDAANA